VLSSPDEPAARNVSTSEALAERVYVDVPDASFERTLTVPVDCTTAWEWMTAPDKCALYAADEVARMSPVGVSAPE